MRIEKLPTAKQLDFLNWEMGVFFHFGIRTFYEGHVDWDMKEMPLDAFNPEELDCEAWIKTAKAAGFRYAILVCKHHDGFANWPSAYTDYSVKNTPWKSGKGDVVREFTEACKKHEMKIGLYYSPAEFGSKNKSAKEYDDYFVNQVSELMSGYGKIDYLWFDGCGSENHSYDTKRIVKAIRTLQPDILLFNMWDPDTRWTGNESGLAQMSNQNVVDSLDFSVQCELDNKDNLDEKRFLPVECDFRIRRANWFYSDLDEDTIKTVDELMGIYDYSVGRGANLLINIAPDRQGLLPQKDCKALADFGDALRLRFKYPVTSTLEKIDCGYVLRFQKPVLVNQVVLCEDLSRDYAVGSFELSVAPFSYGAPIKVYIGETIGHKACCKFSPVYTTEIQVKTDEPKALIKTATAYTDSINFAL